MLAGEQFEQDDAEAVEVAPGVERAELGAEHRELLRRHVGEGATDQRELGAPAELRVFREVEVEQHRTAVVGQQHVRGFQVAVQDAATVRVSQPVGELAGEGQDGVHVG